MMRNQEIVNVLLSVQPGVTKLEYGLCALFVEASWEGLVSDWALPIVRAFVSKWRCENRGGTFVSPQGTWGQKRRRLYADMLAHFSEEVAE